MHKGRLEAFSDGVFAIIITIMVLELKAPHGADWSFIHEKWPIFLAYVMSFIYVGIYWNNHHHMMHTVTKVTGGILWSNLHLLFWLSLIPFCTAWAGENHFAQNTMVLYGINLLLAGVAYKVLQSNIICTHGENALLKQAVGRDLKGYVSIVAYALAIVAAFFMPSLSAAIFILVAVVWLVPDQRIERVFGQ